MQKNLYNVRLVYKTSKFTLQYTYNQVNKQQTSSKILTNKNMRTVAVFSSTIMKKL